MRYTEFPTFGKLILSNFQSSIFTYMFNRHLEFNMFTAKLLIVLPRHSLSTIFPVSVNSCHILSVTGWKSLSHFSLLFFSYLCSIYQDIILPFLSEDFQNLLTSYHIHGYHPGSSTMISHLDDWNSLIIGLSASALALLKTLTNYL